MKTLPLAEVKAKLSSLLSEVEREHDEITVTRNGVPSAVVISADEWESLQETLAVLSDQDALADLKEARETTAEGELYDTDDVLAEFEQQRSHGS
ncbi:type II toxin-antitoxin system Phd/YefM family antitoxin [Halopolyspora algeriensis]|nr:type II toxin-antitoxin system Phd/YefM family antitoxin [Halopolyspora algeriensis]